MSLINSHEASQIILENTISVDTEEIHISMSRQRILAEDIHSDRPFPPFDQVRMDGIAISFEDFKNGHRYFSVEGMQAAGQAKKSKSKHAYCMEVMTGAVLPGGTDTVIRYEDIEIKEKVARILIEDILPNQNVQKAGSYRESGSKLLKSGTLIQAPEIGILASVGKINPLIFKNPKICIVSTGDELVDIDKSPLPHQIRRSNAYTLQSELNKLGLHAELLHFADELDILREAISDLLNLFDVLLFSGAVSKGKFDYLPQVFKEYEVKCLFHGVKQRPGKPFWFGRTDKNIIFAFPGNPVSSFVCFHKYFLPWLVKIYQKATRPLLYGKLNSDFEFKPDLTYYCLVQTQISEEGQIFASPIPGKGSGDLVNLLQVDGILELPADRSLFSKGESFPLILFR